MDSIYYQKNCNETSYMYLCITETISENFGLVATDYAKGFGGKFGIQKDRVDKSAHGWDYQEKVEKHESQTGISFFSKSRCVKCQCCNIVVFRSASFIHAQISLCS